VRIVADNFLSCSAGLLVQNSMFSAYPIILGSYIYIFFSLSKVGVLQLSELLFSIPEVLRLQAACPEDFESLLVIKTRTSL